MCKPPAFCGAAWHYAQSHSTAMSQLTNTISFLRLKLSNGLNFDQTCNTIHLVVVLMNNGLRYFNLLAVLTPPSWRSVWQQDGFGQCYQSIIIPSYDYLGSIFGHNGLMVASMKYFFFNSSTLVRAGLPLSRSFRIVPV